MTAQRRRKTPPVTTLFALVARARLLMKACGQLDLEARIAKLDEEVDELYHELPDDFGDAAHNWKRIAEEAVDVAVVGLSIAALMTPSPEHVVEMMQVALDKWAAQVRDEGRVA